MKASDIAYIVSVIEKSPSSYPRRNVLIAELQDMYRATQGLRYGLDVVHFPIQPEIRVERG
jgi:hypothetical protein